MAYLLDTGILLRLFDRAHAEHAQIRAAIRQIKLRREQLLTTHQNIVEFWNVSTRPPAARGGYALPPSTVNLRVAFIERLCGLLYTNQATHSRWKQLVMQHSIVGVAVHDARIVAAMEVFQISHILTLNPHDFRRYAGIFVVEPKDVATPLQP